MIYFSSSSFNIFPVFLVLVLFLFNFLWNLFASQKRQEETKTRNKLMVTLVVDKTMTTFVGEMDLAY
jgi:hypothetical protein